MKAVVFDLGGVLIDWDPRHLYRPVFGQDEAGMETFLSTVCTPEWNATLDAGRSWEEAIASLVAQHPEQRDLIEAWDTRWPEMLGGALDGTVTVLAELRERGIPLHALSNWSSVKFAVARPMFGFLDWFDSILISGDVGMNKPDIRIFELLLDRAGLDPRETVYVDDTPANVAVATDLGMHALHFADPDALRDELVGVGLLAPVDLRQQP